MLISKVFKWCLVLFTILNTCPCLEAAETKENGAQKNVYKRNLDRQRMRRTRNRWANFRRMNNNQSYWLSFTPPTPNPDEVDCHIDIVLRETVDGRCVRLGGQLQTAVCQSGIHLDYFNTNCESILASRESGGVARVAGVTSQSQPTNNNGPGEQ